MILRDSCHFKLSVLCLTTFVCIVNCGRVNLDENHVSNQMIHFVVANRSGCTFSLHSTTSAADLYKSAKECCNITSIIEIQLLGETIANWRSDHNLTLNQIPSLKSLMEELEQLWGPGYRIPIHLHRPIPSEKDWITYASMIQMFGPFGQSHSNLLEKDWYRFILKCLGSRSCLVQDLCEHFNKIFYCDNGEMIMLNLQGQHLNGSIDISKIPESVEKLLFERNSFFTIKGLNQLGGTKLRYLDIRGNPAEINLNDLSVSSAGSKGNPLKLLRVSLRQISQCTVGVQFTVKSGGGSRMIDELVYAATKQWIKTSTLDVIVIGRAHPKYINRERILSHTDAHREMRKRIFKKYDNRGHSVYRRSEREAVR